MNRARSRVNLQRAGTDGRPDYIAERVRRPPLEQPRDVFLPPECSSVALTRMTRTMAASECGGQRSHVLV